MDRNATSSAEMLRLPDHLDTPTFTCEVCKISVRSAQKLMDHVNFSPLHQASLGLGKSSKADDRAKFAGQMRRLLYDGSKLFWRVNETLDLCIYEDAAANCVTIRAFTQKSPQSLENDSKKSSEDPIPALEVDLRRLRQTLGLEAAPKSSGVQGRMMYPPTNTMSSTTLAHKSKTAMEPSTPEHVGEQITKYLLARLQAHRDSHDRVLLILQMINDDDVDPADLLLVSSGGSQTMPTDLAIRRRHTIDDVKEAQKEVSVAAARLKNARLKAEELSNLARMTLDAFSKHHGSHDANEKRMVIRDQVNIAALASSASNTILGMSGNGRRFSGMGDKPAAAWVRAYDRVVLQNAVERSKDMIEHLPQYDDRMGPIDEAK